MKKCDRCRKEKTWGGDDIQCPFESKETFGDNWNCGIIGSVRFIAKATDPRIKLTAMSDQQYTATIDIFDVEDDEGDQFGLTLWVTWYKNRGRTDSMWILDDIRSPRVPTFDELTKIVDHFWSLASEAPIKYDG